jgi:hypothetical protein
LLFLIRQYFREGTYTPQGGTELSTRQAGIEQNPRMGMERTAGNLRNVGYTYYSDTGVYTPLCRGVDPAEGGSERIC